MRPRSWNPIVGAFIIMTLLFLGTLSGFAWVVSDVQSLAKKNNEIVENVKDLVKENKNRITEIQKSRIEACKSTFSGIHKVFEPFFPPPPRTPEQQTNLDKFNKTISDLTQECTKEVAKGGKK